MNSNQFATLPPLARTIAVFAGTLCMASCAGLIPGPADDTDDELVRHSGPRATVKIAENAFSMNKRGSGYSVTTTGPDGRQQTHSVQWSAGWSRGHAANLEAFFTDAMTNSQAFYVIASGAEEIYEDEQLRKDGILADQSSNKGQAERAELLLRCSVTKMDDNASGSKTKGSGGGLIGDMVPTFLKGGAGRSTQKAEVALMIEIVDRRTRRVLATARGEAFSVGGTKDAGVAGWSSRAIFGSGSDSEYENVDMEAAIRRATVRAVNELVAKVPQKYFTHE